MTDFKEILKTTKNKVLITMFPHPDDETMMTGGLIVSAKKAGWKVIVVSLTNGEAGKIHINGKGKSLKEVRRKELQTCAKVLGVDEVIIGDWGDGNLKNNVNLWTRWVRNILKENNPGIVVTYDPSGFYGHPDHIALSQMLLTDFQKTATAKYNLFFVALPELYRRNKVLKGMDQVEENMVDSTHEIDYGRDWVRKWQAARQHKSQALAKDLPIPMWLFLAMFHKEYFHLVCSDKTYEYKYIDYEL